MVCDVYDEKILYSLLKNCLRNSRPRNITSSIEAKVGP
jgi:hypothetical protein